MARTKGKVNEFIAWFEGASEDLLRNQLYYCIGHDWGASKKRKELPPLIRAWAERVSVDLQERRKRGEVRR